jgi:peroxiredoxin
MAKRVRIDTLAPDFVLDDYQGWSVRLSNYRGKKHVVLVFNRGFV